MNILIKIFHIYQFDMNYPLYWKLRVALPKYKGIKRKLIMLWLRRQEAKRNSSTGIGERGNCAIIEGPIDMPHGMISTVIARNTIIKKNV